MMNTILSLPGIKDIRAAFNLLRTHKSLWKYCWVQVLLTILMFSIGIYYFEGIYSFFRGLFPELQNSYNYSTDESFFIIALFKLVWKYIIKVLAMVLGVFLWLFTVFLIYKISMTLLAIIASPFNDALSSHVEELINSSTKPSQDPDIIQSIKIAAVTETQRLLIFLCLFVPLYLFSFFVPGLGQFFLSVFTPIYTAYWLSYDSQVYAMDRRDWKMKNRIQFIFKHPMENGALGGAMFLVLFIPVVHFLAMPLFVTAGTMRFVETEALDLASTK